MNELEQLIAFKFDDKKNTGYKTLYCGVDVFTAVKKMTGALYGSGIIKGEIKFIQDRFLPPNALVTDDPVLSEVLDKIFKREKTSGITSSKSA